MLDNVRRYVRNGSIIVFHDSLKSESNLRYALPRAIEWLKEMDTSFCPSLCKEAIRRKALEAGFSVCGFAEAMPVDSEAATRYANWIAAEKRLNAIYGNYPDLRLDPRTLLDGARTVISMAINYYPKRLQQSDAPNSHITPTATTITTLCAIGCRRWLISYARN